MATQMKISRRWRNAIWNSPITKAIQDLAYQGFTHKTIGRATGTSTSCVAYRLRHLGVKTQNVRNATDAGSIERIMRVLDKRGLKGLGKFGHKRKAG
jgi:hypothetical protein